MGNLEAALYYEKLGYSVIPVSVDKKALIKWEEHQQRKASPEEIQSWFKSFPKANIGIVTGKISNLTVIDIDSDTGRKALDDILPDSFLSPIADTPSGGSHYYCKYSDGVRNAHRFIVDCDIRSEGGYIVAPPSTNGNGKSWKWRDGCKITEMPLPSVPDKVLSIILSYYNIANDVPKNNINVAFSEGNRDETIFHLANYLLKSKMPEEEIERYLMFVASNCDPPFPEAEVKIKLNSAKKREIRSETSLADDVREYALSSSDVFLSSDVVRDLNLSSREDKKNVSKILTRLADETLIEKYGEKRGTWRAIDKNIQEQRWWDDSGEPLPFRYPLGIENFAKVFAGNVILIEGQKSQGKTAFALELCRLNAHLFDGKALYQNVEMSASEIKQRFESYGDTFTLRQWRDAVMIIKSTRNWWDKILPNGLNIVDYLIEYEKSYLKAKFIQNIHDKLDRGVAIVLSQRDPLKPYPYGGSAIRDIPRLIISLLGHKLKLEDVKSYHDTMGRNPTGLVRKYKQANWWKFVPDSEWDYEEETKYAAFKK